MGKQRKNWLALAIVGALTGMSLHGSVYAAEVDGEETAHELRLDERSSQAALSSAGKISACSARRTSWRRRFKR